MQYVEIYRLQADNSQKVVATCRLEGTAVQCTGDAEICRQLTSDGILNYSEPNPSQLFPNDGQKFLEQLPNHFRSGYLTASPVKEH